MIVESLAYIAGAIAIGVFIDKMYTMLSLNTGYSNTVRIVLQMLTLVAIVEIVDIVCKHMRLKTITDNVFFVSVFLGVQTALFRDINESARNVVGF